MSSIPSDVGKVESFIDMMKRYEDSGLLLEFLCAFFADMSNEEMKRRKDYANEMWDLE